MNKTDLQLARDVEEALGDPIENWRAHDLRCWECKYVEGGRPVFCPEGVRLRTLAFAELDRMAGVEYGMHRGA